MGLFSKREETKEVKLEGILKSIGNVNSSGDNTDVLNMCVITIQEGNCCCNDNKKEHKITFFGLIFPESIGHKVSYKGYGFDAQELFDKENERTYMGGKIRRHHKIIPKGTL